MKKQLDDIKRITLEAGDLIMQVYTSADFGVETKEDEGFISPLTKADKLANDHIVSELQKISELPVVSEEGSHDAESADEFWLVDPLDGTKEFVKQNGEFTVNIALIKNYQPILGVVYAPAKKVMYYGGQDIGAFKQEDGKEPVAIKSEFAGEIPIVFASRSHNSRETEDFLKTIGKHHKGSMGSSLKLCLVAEGVAAAYPRFAPTMLWDTAAAHAVVKEAGGSVKDPKGIELTYDPSKDIKNPFFIVRANNFIAG